MNITRLFLITLFIYLLVFLLNAICVWFKAGHVAFLIIFIGYFINPLILILITVPWVFFIWRKLTCGIFCKFTISIIVFIFFLLLGIIFQKISLLYLQNLNQIARNRPTDQPVTGPVRAIKKSMNSKDVSRR